MVIERLIVDPRYLRLTDQQKVFVKTLCEHGNDKIQAALAAWDCKSPASAQTMANRALRKPEIRKLTSEFFGKDIADERMSREEWLSVTAQCARTAEKDADRYRFLTLIANAEGWFKKPTEVEPDPDEDGEREESIMDRVRQLEK